MPELPEVETVVRGLKSTIIGKKIADVTLRRDSLRDPLPIGLRDFLADEIIEKIERRAKYFLIYTKNHVILGHLGMSGKIILKQEPPENYAKHDHVIFHFDDGMELVYNDPRRFGMLDISSPEEIANHPKLKLLGIEPLDSDFNGKALENITKSRKRPIKIILMDHTLLVGVGNIYACEALFRSSISPLRLAETLTKKECDILSNNIKEILLEAIESGGSTLRDYVKSSGESGYFQHKFAVYGREKSPCPSCKTEITRIKQSGRSTFFCKNCQK